jgi:hypothetical protein
MPSLSSVADSETAWLDLLPALPEAQRRWLAGVKAIEWGRGGLHRVQQLTHYSVNTVRKGIADVQRGLPETPPGRLRQEGAGRKPVETEDPRILSALRGLVQESTAGNPMSSLQWTHKSTRTLAEELTKKGHPVSANTVGRLLEKLGYSLQVNAKSKEGRHSPERDLQFHHINEQVAVFQREGDPVLSVDCKKKEKVGEFKNAGKTYRPKGKPIEVNVYDFPDLAMGKAVPYGVYDVAQNRGFVNVGITYETSEFAVASLRRWWKLIGREMYPRATGWLVCADGGGSNGSRNRGWKVHLQELAEELSLPVTLCHYPPGTSKWNKIEHRLFSFISLNWQGVPLDSYETVISLIGGTKTKGGLEVKAKLDKRMYPKGEEITDEQMASLNIVEHEVNPQWNYTIYPRNYPVKAKKEAKAKVRKASSK